MADPGTMTRLEILANRDRAPGALCIGFVGAADAALTSLFSGPEFTALAERVPCWVRASQFATLTADLQAALSRAGCQALPSEILEPAPDQWPAVLPREKHWVAGDWYLAPPGQPVAHQMASRTLALHLVELVAADADNCEIEAVLRQDPSLSYRLLRLVNSPGIGVGRPISSFTQAIVILGRQHLRRWLNLLLFATRRDDPRAAMLLARVALRARRMELLQKAKGGDRALQEQAFLVGMFSLLGTLFGAPLEDVLKPLHLAEPMMLALCRQGGEMGELGQLLDFARALESEAAMVTPEFQRSLEAQEISGDELGRIGFDAGSWMMDVVAEAFGAPHA